MNKKRFTRKVTSYQKLYGRIFYPIFHDICHFIQLCKITLQFFRFRGGGKLPHLPLAGAPALRVDRGARTFCTTNLAKIGREKRGCLEGLEWEGDTM